MTDKNISIQNLNKPKDAFEQLDDEEGTKQGLIHIRIQQRTGRKTITTVQGIALEYDLKKIVRYLKKEYNCNGTVVEHPEYGELKLELRKMKIVKCMVFECFYFAILLRKRF
ncbi:Eukaryotic translation initiation factor [Trichinella spiralis]|uniref:Eukaryotic translation initiation factor n=1 Tax=Trichinella spiralis TaxID=6334 RepID=A0ABR3KBF7_TRISP